MILVVVTEGAVILLEALHLHVNPISFLFQIPNILIYTICHIKLLPNVQSWLHPGICLIIDIWGKNCDWQTPPPLFGNFTKKSRIQETKNLSTNADSFFPAATAEGGGGQG